MEKWKNKIYPLELILTSDDKTDQSVNFLDLHLEIKNQQFFIANSTKEASLTLKLLKVQVMWWRIRRRNVFIYSENKLRFLRALFNYDFVNFSNILHI